MPTSGVMAGNGSHSEWLRIAQAADLLAVSHSTVRRWADCGRLACQRTPSGQRRFRRSDLEAHATGAPRVVGSALAAEAEQRYQLLLETSLELASSLDLDEVLQSAARRLSAALDIPDCDIYRLEGDERLVCLASTIDGVLDAPGSATSSHSTTGPATGSPSRRAAPVAVASLDDPRLSEVERDDMRRYGQRSFIVLPLIARDKVIGMVDLLDHVEREFTAEEIAVAEAVGQLVALALEHAQLYEEVKRLHLGNLRALSSALSAKDYYTLGHASRVAAYTALLGRELAGPTSASSELAERRLPARHRQDRRLRPRAAQGRPADLRGVGAHPPAPRHQRRDRAAAVRRRSSSPACATTTSASTAAATPTAWPARRSRWSPARMCVVDCYDAMSCERPYRPRAELPPVPGRAAALRRHAVRPRDGRGLLDASCGACGGGGREVDGARRAGRGAGRPGRPRPAAHARTTRRARSTREMVAALRALPRRAPAGALHHELRDWRATSASPCSTPARPRARSRTSATRGWPQDELAAVLAGERLRPTS